MGVGFAIGGAVDSLFGNQSAPNPTSTISSSFFSGNEALAGSGGGAFALTGGGAVSFTASPLNVSYSSFLGNQAVGSEGPSGGAGTDADGGAMWIMGSSVTIQGGLIAGNSAVGRRRRGCPWRHRRRWR